jgi:hypothetical protein
LNNSKKRRVGAPGLQNFHADHRICSPGALTGRFLQKPAGETISIFLEANWGEMALASLERRNSFKTTNKEL